jgi:hypothetical protein
VLTGAIAAELGGAAVRALPQTDEQWRALLAAADWHRLAPVLARQLTPGTAPDWVLTRLREQSLQDAARAALLDNARARVLQALADAGVPAIALKGSALVETIYPDSTWRDMSDIDLLVKPDRYADAVAAVTGLGYAPLPGATAEPGNARHDPKLVSADGLVPVEIHRHVLDDVDARFDLAEVWARSRPSPAGTHRLAAPHDLLIHVAMHFLAGRSVRSEGALSQLRDIAWIAARGDVDWAALQDVSRRFGVGGRVRLALAVAEQLGLVRAPLPPLSRRDAAHARHFAASRVLTDRALVPLGSWSADRSGLRELLWWGRTHLGDTPAGEIPDDNEGRKNAAIGRATALRRAALSLASAPATAVRDLRVGRWLRTLQ